MKYLIAIALTAIAGATSLPAAATLIGPYAGSWSESDATQTGRLFRDSVASVAGTPKSFPGAFSTGNSFAYEVFQFENFGAADAITVNATVSDTNTHLAAYSGWTYDNVLANNAANYLGDLGSSLSQPFSFDVAALGQFIVVASTNSSSRSGEFSFTVEGAQLTPPNQNHQDVPEPASLALLLASLGAAGAATGRKARAAAAKAD